MTEIVVVDIGGTHARFAIADVAGGTVAALGPETVVRTADHGTFELAWNAFRAQARRVLPRAAAISIASPVGGEALKLTNNPWVIRPRLLPQSLGLDTLTIVNDFGAVGHAVAGVGCEHLKHICGPDQPLPASGVVSIVGPGTGLGVAMLLRSPGGDRVIETEGGHIDFAPLDGFEDAVLTMLRERHNRVSVERIVSGPGLASIWEALCRAEGRPTMLMDDKTLWSAALNKTDGLAAAALDRFCLSLGAVAGDIALAQGAAAVVIGGGVGLRLADRLSDSGFAQRFTAKGRFSQRMAALPVKLITHPQPGLYGAAAAYAQEHAPA